MLGLEGSFQKQIRSRADCVLRALTGCQAAHLRRICRTLAPTMAACLDRTATQERAAAAIAAVSDKSCGPPARWLPLTTIQFQPCSQAQGQRDIVRQMETSEQMTAEVAWVAR